jgi:dTDP-4-amino-4,6-dideoxygalactose transaminase
LLNTSFSPWPSFSEEEAEAIKNILLSDKVNYWTGEEGRLFEKEFANWVGANHAVALANGTLALDLALKALNIGLGDDVIVTPRTFIASVSCVVNSGANPVFADIDLNSQNITAESIEVVLTPKTKAIIVVHLAGMPAEMDEIMLLAKKHNLYVIEDCAQAHGAIYKGRSVGSIGHIGAWSFCQDKIMSTAGEGGMVTTNDKSLWLKMWSYKDHGKSYDAVYEKKHAPGFRWLHESFGTNYRMTEIQAVIGRMQLKKMPEWTKLRGLNADRFNLSLSRYNCTRVIKIPAYIKHAHYKHYAFINTEYLKKSWSRDRIISELLALDTPCYQGSCSEVYLEKAFDFLACRPSVRLQNAKLLGETSLMFLVHPTLQEEELSKFCGAIETVLAKASL